jgi:hypothetical protein
MTLYQAGTQIATSTVGAKVDSMSFSALTPGTKYEVEVVSRAGPFRTAAANVSGWTCEWSVGKAARGGAVAKAASETPGFLPQWHASRTLVHLSPPYRGHCGRSVSPWYPVGLLGPESGTWLTCSPSLHSPTHSQ